MNLRTFILTNAREQWLANAKARASTENEKTMARVIIAEIDAMIHETNPRGTPLGAPMDADWTHFDSTLPEAK